MPDAGAVQILLTDLRRNPLTEWFRREQELAQPGAAYTSKIAQPIDLDRVQRKLDAGDYGAKPDAEAAGDFNLTSFKNDVLLVFQNAEAFNEDGRNRSEKQRRGSGAQAAIKNPYKRIAQLLIKTFNLRFETLCTTRPAGGAVRAREARPRRHADLRREARAVPRACAQLPLYEAGRVHGSSEGAPGRGRSLGRRSGGRHR